MGPEPRRGERGPSEGPRKVVQPSGETEGLGGTKGDCGILYQTSESK